MSQQSPGSPSRRRGAPWVSDAIASEPRKGSTIRRRLCATLTGLVLVAVPGPGVRWPSASRPRALLSDPFRIAGPRYGQRSGRSPGKGDHHRQEALTGRDSRLPTRAWARLPTRPPAVRAQALRSRPRDRAWVSWFRMVSQARHEPMPHARAARQQDEQAPPMSRNPPRPNRNANQRFLTPFPRFSAPYQKPLHDCRSRPLGGGAFNLRKGT